MLLPFVLILAEHGVAASCALAAAGAAVGAHGRRGSCPFGDGPRASADQPLHRSAAFRADFDGGIRHLLALLKAAGAGIAKIFVGGHGQSPFARSDLAIILRET